MDPTCQQGTVQADGGSVMVWSVCSWRNMGPWIRLDTTLTGDRHFRWPPKSSNMNIIGIPCSGLFRTESPSILIPTDLWSALQDSWCQLPPALLQTLIESMPRRIAALLCARRSLILH
ncbi:transposable element Tcb2 transposase [Trichonephila clavipes]|nr:transposable element Tcb2 transposase [Trichonephila clavipes]